VIFICSCIFNPSLPAGGSTTTTRAKKPLPMLIQIQPDATVCRYLFTAKLLYMFWVPQHPSSGVLKTVTAASVTGHTVKYKD